MSNEAQYIQPGFTAITPYLYARPGLGEFLQRAFGAEIVHDSAPDGAGRFHCEAKIGDAHILFGNGYFSDASLSAAIYLYVPDVDDTYKRALSLGATALRPPSDQTWGDRVGGVRDPSGNSWWIATHKGAK